MCLFKKVADQTEDGEQSWTGWYDRIKNAGTGAGGLEGEGNRLKNI